MPIIRLLRNFLVGEVAHKMGMTKEEVFKYLNGEDDEHNDNK